MKTWLCEKNEKYNAPFICKLYTLRLSLKQWFISLWNKFEVMVWFNLKNWEYAMHLLLSNHIHVHVPLKWVLNKGLT